jgi:NAD(P)-dependent dehydrogenase (short-subunit alcohol dehydrogenase family)
MSHLELGPLSIACSNAGVADWQAWTEITEQSFDRIVGVNLTGAFNVGQAAARAMVERAEGGRIVFTSSVHAQMCFPTMAVYGATKQAVRALVETMAIELGEHGITVNHIGPGWVKSQLNDSSPGLRTEEDERNTLKLIPIPRPSEPIEQGRAVVYLCSSPDGDYVTGEFLRVDGGFVVGKY